MAERGRPGRVQPLLAAQCVRQTGGGLPGVEQAVQVGAKDIARGTALGPSVRQAAEGRALHPGGAHMDLIAVQRGPRKGSGQGRALHPGAGLLGAEYRLGGQKAQPPADCPRLSALHPVGVGEGTPQHLVSPADAQHRYLGGGQLEDGGFEAAPAQPAQVVQGALGAGQNHQIRQAQSLRPVHIPHPHQRMLLQRGKIGEIGDAGQTHHRRIDGAASFGLVQPGRQGILVVDLHPDIGHHPQHRHPGLFFQGGQAGTQDRRVAPEFVDHQALDAGPLVGVQQGHRAVQLGKHPAPVDIPCQQHRRIHHPGQAHVDDVVRLEVDLSRAARPLDDDDVVFRRQAVVGRQDLGHQLFFVPEILGGGHLPPHLPMDDHLAAHIAARLEQDGVHPHIRFGPGGLGLYHLGPAHLQALPGDIAVQGHILALERGAAQPVLPENAAQGGAQQAFARPGHGALHHDAARPPHPSTSSSAASRRLFSSSVRTAVRYQPSSSPG